eukprot:423117-Rhodomonas_salina.2
MRFLIFDFSSGARRRACVVNILRFVRLAPILVLFHLLSPVLPLPSLLSILLLPLRSAAPAGVRVSLEEDADEAVDSPSIPHTTFS